VKRLRMLVNTNGQWVFPGSAEFFEALGDADPDYDASAFAVKNLGFIEFTLIGDTLIEIELHPRNVAYPALLAVQHQIQSSHSRLFRIKYFDSEWRSEITSSPEQAITRLSQLAAPHFEPAARERFTVEPRDYSQLFGDETNPLRFMAQKWRMSFGEFDSGFISFAVQHQMLSNMLIIGVQPPRASPVFRFIGEAHTSWLDGDQCFRAIGENTESVPDREYAGWASEFYKDVAATGQPRYDCVTATIQRPMESYRTRYERLILPWKTSSDEILISVSPKKVSDDAPTTNASSGSSNAPTRNSTRS
jgi:hypothetical protein